MLIADACRATLMLLIILMLRFAAAFRHAIRHMPPRYFFTVTPAADIADCCCRFSTLLLPRRRCMSAATLLMPLRYGFHIHDAMRRGYAMSWPPSAAAVAAISSLMSTR